jgi:hypothetical protein
MQDSLEVKLAEISGEIYKQNAYLVGMHLRDAVNVLSTMRSIPTSARPDLLARACILFAAAGLETNLSYFCTLALAISEAVPAGSIYKEPETEYLRAVRTTFSKDANLSDEKQAQPLSDRLLRVPKLLGKAFGREFAMAPGEPIGDRLDVLIEKRDALIHPSWDRYPEVGLEDAADAIYGVLDYLETVRQQFHPFLIGYMTLLSAYFPLVTDLVGDQPLPLPPRFRVLESREELMAALAGEWVDAHTMFDIANVHGTEGDSEGSMLTRAALVSVYSMVMAHVSLLGKMAVVLNPGLFSEKEINFLNEKDYQWSDEGELILDTAKQTFKVRATVAMTLIAKKVSPNALAFQEGVTWFQRMFKEYLPMRNRVMHSKFGETTARVTKPELREAFEAIRSYAAHVALAGGILAFYQGLLDRSPLKYLSPEAS